VGIAPGVPGLRAGAGPPGERSRFALSKKNEELALLEVPYCYCCSNLRREGARLMCFTF
jgi:hypothetical protein